MDLAFLSSHQRSFFSDSEQPHSKSEHQWIWSSFRALNSYIQKFDFNRFCLPFALSEIWELFLTFWTTTLKNLTSIDLAFLSHHPKVNGALQPSPLSRWKKYYPSNEWMNQKKRVCFLKKFFNFNPLYIYATCMCKFR